MKFLITLFLLITAAFHAEMDSSNQIVIATQPTRAVSVKPGDIKGGSYPDMVVAFSNNDKIIQKEKIIRLKKVRMLYKLCIGLYYTSLFTYKNYFSNNINNEVIC